MTADCRKTSQQLVKNRVRSVGRSDGKRFATGRFPAVSCDQSVSNVCLSCPPQRRLRHLRSIAARNIVNKNGSPLLDTYFTLHLCQEDRITRGDILLFYCTVFLCQMRRRQFGPPRLTSNESTRNLWSCDVLDGLGTES